jgi:hypothetical protein
MNVTQISVFMENRPGRLAYLLQVFSAAQVNLRALSVADSADFGIARVIVNDVDAAIEAIHAAGMTAVTTEVLRVEIPDVPGGLAQAVIEPLADANINIQYSYAFSERPSAKAVVVLKVDDLEKAAQVLA